MSGELKRLAEAEYAADKGRTPVIAQPRDVRAALALLKRAKWYVEYVYQDADPNTVNSPMYDAYQWLQDYEDARGE